MYKRYCVQCCYSSIAHSIICTRLFRGKMHSDWFNGIEIFQVRWQHGEKVGCCYPSGLEKTLCKWGISKCLCSGHCKTASLDYDGLETVRSAISCLAANDGQEVLRGSFLGIVLILVRDPVSLSITFVPYLQLWHLRSLSSVQSVGDGHSQVPSGLHFPF